MKQKIGEILFLSINFQTTVETTGTEPSFIFNSNSKHTINENLISIVTLLVNQNEIKAQLTVNNVF